MLEKTFLLEKLKTSKIGATQKNDLPKSLSKNQGLEQNSKETSGKASIWLNVFSKHFSLK